jgi:hypothetical protein
MSSTYHVEGSRGHGRGARRGGVDALDILPAYYASLSVSYWFGGDADGVH